MPVILALGRQRCNVTTEFIARLGYKNQTKLKISFSIVHEIVYYWFIAL